MIVLMVVHRKDIKKQKVKIKKKSVFPMKDHFYEKKRDRFYLKES